MKALNVAVALFDKKVWAKSRRSRHVAVVVRGGALVAVGYNRGSAHAEVSALNRLWPSERRGTRVWSLRMGAGGQLRVARPCQNCMRYLRESGVKAVYYSDEVGAIRREKP